MEPLFRILALASMLLLLIGMISHETILFGHSRIKSRTACFLIYSGIFLLSLAILETLATVTSAQR